MDCFGDDTEFGGIDENDFLFAATQAEESGTNPKPAPLDIRPSKRRRLDQPGVDLTKVLRGENESYESTSSLVEPRRSCSPRADEPGTPQEKSKSKYKIHIPKNAQIPKDVYFTQAPESQGSPHRISGPRWQKPQKAFATPNLGPQNGIRRPLEAQNHTQPNSGDILDRRKSASQHASERVSTSGGTDYKPARSGLQLINVTPKTGGDVEGHCEDRATVVGAQRPSLSYAEELADIPANAFSSPVAQKRGAVAKPIALSSQGLSSQAWPTQLTQHPRLVAPQANLRQTTLFGDQAAVDTSQSQLMRRHNWPLASREEPPTHHQLNEDALKTWVYPTNLGTIRDYQYTIVARGLYHNLLVALPTGLGKTFIAATIMLNWFQWTSTAQIVFVAPTKPLVAQQVKACFEVAGIPRSETVMLTGGTPPGIRAEEWRSKRVFFMTPQTIVNDLKTGICDPKRIVLIVVDEAHRATGGYAYVEVVNFLKRFNTSFRVLALTATPGASVESVQEVIDGLGISAIDIRTEQSIDIRPYVHSRKVETILFDQSEEMEMISDLFSKALQPVLDKLNGMNAYWARDPMTLTAYGCNQARQKWMLSNAGKNANFGVKGMVNTIFSLLASLAHGIELLKFHGMGPFYHKVLAFRKETNTGEKGSKYRKQIVENEDFQTMMATLQVWISNPDFIGHPKLEYLQSVVLNHFLDAGDGRGAAAPLSTRIMIFVHYRDSAEEVSRVLKRNEPMIRPHVFVGQANSKGSDGMDQKTQLEVVQKFKDGIYNTLVATSIGEEGLDIGEVDLIVCYDASASPIRMLQRMGRTGRKRAGNIVVTLMKGKEENNFIRAKDNYEKMQVKIAAGTDFVFHHDESRRILPKTVQPIVDKKLVEIPIENSQPELPEPKKRAKVPKRPPKKFNMPDGARTGFVKASRVNANTDTEDEVELKGARGAPQPRFPAIESVPLLDEIILNAIEEKELERRYLDVGGDTPQIVEAPRVDAFPTLQRSLRKTKKVMHGRATKRVVTMLQKMHNIPKTIKEQHISYLRDGDRREGLAQAEKRALYFGMTRRSSPMSQPEDRHRSRGPSSTHKRVQDVSPIIALPSSDIESGRPKDAKFLSSGDTEDDQDLASSASSPSPLHHKDQPFYLLQERGVAPSESGSEEELPDVGALVKKADSTAPAISADPSKTQLFARFSHRRRRAIIEEEDSDD